MLAEKYSCKISIRKAEEKKVGSRSIYKREVQGNNIFRSSLSVEVITTSGLRAKNIYFLFIYYFNLNPLKKK
jgi:hypothetical protein